MVEEAVVALTFVTCTQPLSPSRLLWEFVFHSYRERELFVPNRSFPRLCPSCSVICFVFRVFFCFPLVVVVDQGCFFRLRGRPGDRPVKQRPDEDQTRGAFFFFFALVYGWIVVS